MTMAEFIDNHYGAIALAHLAPKWQVAVRRQWQRLADAFPGELAALNAEQVERWWAALPPTWGPQYRHHHLVALRSLCKAAVRWGYLAGDPTRGIKAPRLPQGRVRWFSPEEWETLVREANPTLRLYILSSYYLGARGATLRALRVGDVDLSRNLVTIRTLKRHPEGAFKPLPPKLREALWWRLAGAPEDPLLPPMRDDSLSHAFTALCKRCGIKDATFHSLRHHSATMLAQLGVNQAVVRDHLNHSTLANSSRYTHVTPEVMRQAVGQL
jgi:integrase